MQLLSPFKLSGLLSDVFKFEVQECGSLEDFMLLCFFCTFVVRYLNWPLVVLGGLLFFGSLSWLFGGTHVTIHEWAHSVFALARGCPMGDIPIPYSRLNPIFTSLAPTIRNGWLWVLGGAIIEVVCVVFVLCKDGFICMILKILKHWRFQWSTSRMEHLNSSVVIYLDIEMWVSGVFSSKKDPVAIAYRR